MPKSTFRRQKNFDFDTSDDTEQNSSNCTANTSKLFAISHDAKIDVFSMTERRFDTSDETEHN